jgi:hypothetical protein
MVRKGQLIANWFDYMATIIVLIVLFFVLGVTMTTNTSQADSQLLDLLEIVQADQTLFTLLETPIEYKGVKMTYKDLITLSQIQGQEELLEGIVQTTRNLLNPVYDGEWAINICYEDMGRHSSPCWLFLNEDPWHSQTRNNILRSGTVNFLDHKNELIQVKLRIFSE